MNAKSFHITSNAIQQVGTPGGMYGYFLDNSANGATTYFQFFDKTTPVLGSDTPKFVIPIPANQAANVSLPQPIPFASNIQFAATTTYNGSTAPVSPVDCTIFYA